MRLVCPRIASVHVHDACAFLRAANGELRRTRRKIEHCQQTQIRTGRAPTASDLSALMETTQRAQWILERLQRHLHELEDDAVISTDV